MSEENTAVSDGTPDASSEGNEHDQSNMDTRSVSYESHRRLLAEKKKRDAQLREANERLAAFEAEKEAQRQARLKEEGKFNELTKEYEAKLAARENELNQYKRTVQNSVKFNAIRKTLGADIDYKWHDFFDVKQVFDGVEIGEDGRPEEMSVTKVCDFIKKEYPEVIRIEGGKGNMPSDAPKGTGKKTLADMSLDERAEMFTQMVRNRQ